MTQITTPMVPLIDGDIVLCRAGFVVETRYYLVLKEGVDPVGSFQYKKEAKEFVGEANDLEIAQAREAEPLENALKVAKDILLNILENCRSEDYRLFLSGQYNFRKSNPYYKANRREFDKPILEPEIYKYLVNQWDAEIVDGMEADDQLGIEQTDGTVICSTDKDLKMIPGWHYDFVKDEFLEVDENSGILSFLKQLITGDSTDNIFGIYGMGDKRADSFINAFIGEDNWKDTILQQILEMYKDNNREEDFYENARLLWILRSPDDDWRNWFNVEGNH